MYPMSGQQFLFYYFYSFIGIRVTKINRLFNPIRTTIFKKLCFLKALIFLELQDDTYFRFFL